MPAVGRRRASRVGRGPKEAAPPLNHVGQHGGYKGSASRFTAAKCGLRPVFWSIVETDVLLRVETVSGHDTA